ncbi:16775_t:CDS:2 [Acaulospora morrowiae]|uniref:Restriction of telomere capping protein 4 n=1 Tax=Acaulospora morrowiae TaxID=94023 RepID=A0A9N8YXI9_9GLOM|nr:16775_t:CDS:2 [Acaulospora morrowiae]
MSSELEKILNGEKKSSFMKNALEAHKKHGCGATNPMILINRFEEFMDAVILSGLSSLFKKVTYRKTKSLRSMDFFEEVLVPEIAIRLIFEDCKILLDEAKIVMSDSVKFGIYMYKNVEI